LRARSVPEPRCGATQRADISSVKVNHQADIELRQIEYLNNIVEQDQRANREKISVSP
jgi:transposase-like protein